MTVETRPDAMTEQQGAASMRLGMTRVEMGVQVLDDNILRQVNRGHGLQAIIDATAVAKRSGLKVCYHIMPGLPRARRRTRTWRASAACSTILAYRPDMLKIYPTLGGQGHEASRDCGRPGSIALTIPLRRWRSSAA